HSYQENGIGPMTNETTTKSGPRQKWSKSTLVHGGKVLQLTSRSALSPLTLTLRMPDSRNARYIVKAPRPQPAMTAANGTAVLFPNSPTSAPAVAPSTNCSVPRSADALPAIAPYGAIASAVVLGMMNP